MFYTEEDVEPAVNIAVELFGPVGNMLDGKGVHKNLIIGIPQFGKIWYGDVVGDMDYIIGLINILTSRSNCRSLVVGENF